MIRQALESAYRRTIGTLRNGVVGVLESLTKRGGLVQALYVLILVALMAGFVTAVVYRVPNQTYIPYPNTQAETIPEAIVNAFIIFAGGAGVYLVYLSGRQTVRARTVNLYLGLALLLLVVAIFAGIDLAILKGLG
jgi:predicted ABC-type sugar transport system permease subunit